MTMAAAASDRLIIGIPSKGRLMEKTLEKFSLAGFTISKTGHERGYLGRIDELEAVDVHFLSASEIAYQLKAGLIHLGVTGEDLVRELTPDCQPDVTFVLPLNFGAADVVIAVPQCWLDVQDVADLGEVMLHFRQRHGHLMRVATKYQNLTRDFFNRANLTHYTIVGSVGATEGAPAAESAELIVDITSTGTTLKANGLKILQHGVILKSQANLIASNAVEWSDHTSEMRARIEAGFKQL